MKVLLQCINVQTLQASTCYSKKTRKPKSICRFQECPKQLNATKIEEFIGFEYLMEIRLSKPNHQSSVKGHG